MDLDKAVNKSINFKSTVKKDFSWEEVQILVAIKCQTSLAPIILFSENLLCQLERVIEDCFLTHMKRKPKRHKFTITLMRRFLQVHITQGLISCKDQPIGTTIKLPNKPAQELLIILNGTLNIQF